MIKGFTEQSIKVLTLADEESRRLGYNFVDTEYILLGMLGEGTSVAAQLIESMEVTLEQARIEVEKIIGRGPGSVSASIAFLPKASRAIELAEEECQQLGQDIIDADHVLLGTLRVEDGTALQVLRNLGVDPAELRALVVRRLGENTEVTED